ncbi:hypothetical protein [Ruminococcus sp.]|uniref:hypothetical protein n=1 Tax=Ruminococcus sp. TaxID=41978 RepID=UPI003867D105
MKELRIVRGTDVKLFIGDVPLFGVTDFTAVQKPRYYDVFEYLRSKPCERIPQGSRYEIKLEFMALFDGQLPMQEDFTLNVTNNGTIYCYKNCRVTERKTALKGDQKAVEVFLIEADQMRKAVTDDA